MTTSCGTIGVRERLTPLADLVHEAASVEQLLTRAQIVQLKVLARAGELAELQAADSPARVQAHEMALRSIAAELGGVLRVSDRTMQRRIAEARTIVDGYPGSLSAWGAGLITRGHVLVIVDAGADLPAEVRPAFEASRSSGAGTTPPTECEPRSRSSRTGCIRDRSLNATRMPLRDAVCGCFPDVTA